MRETTAEPRSDGREATRATPGSLEQLDFRRFRLRVGEGASRAFDRRAILIGSNPDSDLVVDHPTVSRVHARLEYDGRGYRLTDLGSRNGVTVDGVRVETAWLGETARLGLGDAVVWFALDAERVAVELARAARLGPLVGRSAPMRELFALVARVAPTPVSVLIEGETGTGKELVAETLHAQSERSDRPFIVFDCAAVAPDHVERELFGAGLASGRLQGALGEAAGGTLFLDEVGELPPEVQARLLRVLEGVSGREGREGRGLEARVIAASSRSLAREVEAGHFRGELLLRLGVVRVRVPALRHRPEDIPLLVDHFLQQQRATHVQIGWDTMRRLQEHPWPGNVRELRLAVERAVALASDGRLDARHLAPRGEVRQAVVSELDGARLEVSVDVHLPFKDAKARLLEDFESRYWRRLLEASGGNVTEAARRGGIHRKSLEYIVRKLEL
jgi:DNA-binding NtrC family response regulator